MIKIFTSNHWWLIRIICSNKPYGYFLCSFLILLSCFNSGLKAQENKTITLSVKNAPLEKVLKSFEEQSGYSFFYNYRLLAKANPVTLKIKKANIMEALKACFENQPLHYVVQDKLITIVDLLSTKSSSSRPTIEQDYKGKIIDSLGRGLAGITITCKDLNRSGFSNEDGSFRIHVPTGSVLTFSSVRFNTKQVILTNPDQEMLITLSLKIVNLEEVTVSTGYQELKKSDIAGSISSIKASELYFNGTNTIEQALQGRLPGLVVTNQNGLVGTRQKTRVRGTSTLLGTQEPIWVVDGIIQEDPLPFKASVISNEFGNSGGLSKDNFDYVRDFVGNSIAWLNKNDIEDISILKDASATAIYGVRAANGVIVITTKKGQVGPPVINYGITVNTSEKVSYDRLNLMNSQERIQVSKEIFERGLTGTNENNNIGFAGALNDYLFKRTNYDQFNAQVKILETVNTDWFDILYRNPISINQNLGISGGNVNTRYYASFGYNTINGTAKGNGSNAYTGNLNINTKVNSKLDVSVRLSASGNTTEGFYLTNPYNYVTKTSRVIPAVDQAGNPFFYANFANTNASGYLYNINNELANSGSHNKNISANTSFSINYAIINGLTFQSTYSISNTAVTGNAYATEKTAYIAGIRSYDYGTVGPTNPRYQSSMLPSGGEYTEDNNQNITWSLRNGLSYSKVFKEKHVFSVLLGQETNSVKNTGFSSVNYGYLRDRGLVFATVPSVIGVAPITFPNELLLKTQRIKTDRKTNNIGIYGTLSYAYDDRYVVNFNVRNDRSNRFGQFTEEKFNPVIAGGLRWNVAREKWFENSNWLSDLSLRASIGYQRNIVTNVSPELILKIPTTPASSVVDIFTGDNLLSISSLAYSDLRFEKTLSLNLGLDFSLFKGKINASVEYYEKRSRDLLTFLPVPFEYGVETMPINGGSLNNKGIEVATGFAPIKTKNFTWFININTSKNYNELNNTGIQQNTTWITATSGNLFKDGYPVSGLWAFDFTGVNPANGYPLINLQTNGKTDSSDPTSYMKYVGKLDADFTGGINTNFRYKKLTIGANFNLQVGGKKFLAPLYNLTTGVPSEYDNLSRTILNRWTPTNTGSNIPGLPDRNVGNDILLPDGKTYTNVYEMYNYSTDRIVNASSLTCNNIALSYSLPARIVSALRVKNINTGAGVSQPFAIVSKGFNGIDPEVAIGSQPRIRSYYVNLSVSF